MKKSFGWMGRLGIALALIFGVTFGTVSAASAAVISEPVAAVAPTDSGVAASGIIVKMEDDRTNEPIVSPQSVPMFRWMANTQSFNYQTDGNPIAAAARGVERTIYFGFPMMIGNTMWLASSSLLDGAVGFKPMAIVGLQIDQAAKGIGEAIIKSPLISLAFIMVAFGTLFALKRGERPWRRVWTTSVVAALFVIMVTGSAGSTDNNGSQPGGYSPGMGSPGWFLTAISNTTATITSEVSKSLTIPTFDDSGFGSCDKYVAKVIEGQPEDWVSRSTAPMSSALWTQTGLEAWKLAQFGDSESLSNDVWCHVLDWNNPNSAKTIIESLEGEYPDKVYANSAALSPQNADQRDRSGIAWAVCNWNGETWKTWSWFFTTTDSGESRWGKKDSSDKVDGDNDLRSSYEGNDGFCADWWSTDANEWDSDKFRIGPNSNDTRDFVNGNTNSQLYTFLTNWQGADNSGIAVTFSYSFSSFIISLVFVVVAAAIFFVNIAIVVTLLSVFVVMLVVLFTKNDVESRLLSFVKNLIGLVVFSSVAALLIAMIAKITEVLNVVGKQIFSGTPVAIMLWTGLSPLFALIMLHFVFTKLLRVPSPFKLSSALAWGAAAGAAGGAAGAGVSNMMQRGENKVENAVKSAPGAAARKAKDALSGKKGSDRDGAASAVGGTKGESRNEVSGDGTKDAPKTAVERRAEAKEAKKQAALQRDAEMREKDAKNDKYLGKMDALLGGQGTLPSQTGWRGKFNEISGSLERATGGALGGAQLSDKDYTDGRSVAERIGGRTGQVLEQWKSNMAESRAQFAEKWQNDKGGAIKQVLGTTAKYGALGVAGAMTGGGAVAAYAGYRAVKGGTQAARDVGYMGGSQQYRQNAVSALRQQRAEAAQQKPQQLPSQPQQSAPSRPAPAQPKPSGGGGKPKPSRDS